MVPEIHPFSLSFDFNVNKRRLNGTSVSSIVNCNDGFDHNAIPPSLQRIRRKTFC
jgi:hypothetical protein